MTEHDCDFLIWCSQRRAPSEESEEVIPRKRKISDKEELEVTILPTTGKINLEEDAKHTIDVMISRHCP